MTTAAGRNIQLVAWSVLFAGFVAFVALAVGAPWLTWRYVRSATVEEKATVACKSGSCSLSLGLDVPRVLRSSAQDREVSEGWTVGTDDGARALVRFFDDSTVNLETNTSIVLRQLRRPRFDLSQVPRRIALVANLPPPESVARLRIGSTWGDAEFLVDTVHGRVLVAPESHARLDLSSDHLRVTTSEGSVALVSDGRTVTVRADQRAESRAGAPPTEPRPALENIVVNGDFHASPDARGWTSRVDLPGEVDGAVVPRGFQTVLDDGSKVLRIVRENSESRPADIVFEQQLVDYDVSAATFIGVRARLRVRAQSLPAGGVRGGELPCIIRLVVESAGGEQHEWAAGFYAVPVGPEDGDRYNLKPEWVNVEVALDEWHAFDSGNLLDGREHGSFQRFGLPRPVRLKRLEIVASGHDYASDIDEIAVWVK